MVQHRLQTPEEIAARAGGEIPFLRMPDRRAAFADRAARLRSLAAGHAMADYLLFVAELAEAQQRALEAMPPVRLPSPDALATANEHRMPPLAHSTHLRDPLWCDLARRMLRDFAEQSNARGRVREVAVELEGRRDEYFEAQASKLLSGVTLGLDLAHAPFVGAALQVYFTHLAIALGAAAFPRTDVATLCPCCGARPTASVVRIGGGDAGYRFLHCGLCNAEWHMVRVKCSNCENTRGLGYPVVDDGTPLERKVVKAETCPECGTYLKITNQERDTAAEPVADDLATLSLDILVGESGFAPSGINFMLLHGEPPAA